MGAPAGVGFVEAGDCEVRAAEPHRCQGATGLAGQPARFPERWDAEGRAPTWLCSA